MSISHSKFYRSQSPKVKDVIDQVAYYRFQKRDQVHGLTGIRLPGDEIDDWTKAEHLFRNYKFDAKPATYTQQIQSACEIFTDMRDRNRRNHHCTGPFQVGKTGTALLTAELFLADCHSKRQKGHVFFVNLVGQVGLEDQLTTRIDMYSVTSCVDGFSLQVSPYRCNGWRS